jgi:hypothetical protein
MNQRHEQEDDSSGPRRRRLDELFADEPFLSPTMKARRLLEKLNEQSADNAPGQASPETQGLPSEAYVRSAPERSVRRESAQPRFTPGAEPHGKAVPTVSLIDAAIYLRSKGSQTPRTVSMEAQGRLAAFRGSVLETWVTAVEE